MRNFCIYIIVPLCIIAIVFCIFKIGVDIGRAQIAKEALSKIPQKGNINALLNDFRNLNFDK